MSETSATTQEASDNERTAKAIAVRGMAVATEYWHMGLAERLPLQYPDSTNGHISKQKLTTAPFRQKGNQWARLNVVFSNDLDERIFDVKIALQEPTVPGSLPKVLPSNPRFGKGPGVEIDRLGRPVYPEDASEPGTNRFEDVAVVYDNPDGARIEMDGFGDMLYPEANPEDILTQGFDSAEVSHLRLGTRR